MDRKVQDDGRNKLRRIGEGERGKQTMRIGDEVGEGWEDKERIWSTGREAKKEVVVRGGKNTGIRRMSEDEEKKKLDTGKSDNR
jgi:hypothetical protein